MSQLIMKNRMPKPVASLIRLVLIDGQVLSRAGIQAILSNQTDFEVVGEAPNGIDAITLVEHVQPDVILMNIGSNDGKNGLDVLPQILAVSEESRLLVLMESYDAEMQHKAVCQGAMGVITMDKPPEILIKAIERIHAGEVWLDRSMTASVLSTLSPAGRAKKIDPDEAKIKTLTERELEVIKLVGEGLKNRAIGERLFISEITVHHHLTSIYSKLEVADRLELIVYAYKNGLAQLPH
jgi:two-component system, NarL family, nitrate/nitrite response regulator NarL